MILELRYEFLRDAGVPLNDEDLRLGLSLGLISPVTAVATARGVVDRGSDDPTILKLAETEGTHVAEVRDVLQAVDPESVELSPPQSVRKWLYLELKAAFELRNQLRDPLGFVEEIYADFDYPEAVAAFVRYMPAPAGERTGEPALYDRWSRYLVAEALDLAR